MSSRKKSDKLVGKLMKDMGGKVVPNSGATWHSKGDGDLRDWKVEHKFTEKKSYSLKRTDLEKHFKESYEDGKCPVFIVEFMDSNKSKPARSIAIIDLAMFQGLIEEEEEEDGQS